MGDGSDSHDGRIIISVVMRTTSKTTLMLTIMRTTTMMSRKMLKMLTAQLNMKKGMSILIILIITRFKRILVDVIYYQRHSIHDHRLQSFSQISKNYVNRYYKHTVKEVVLVPVLVLVLLLLLLLMMMMRKIAKI